jgi:hypothetical protein
MMNILSKWAILGGMLYLQAICIFSLIVVDLPARSGDPKGACTLQGSNGGNILQCRKHVFCVLLTTGILANVVLHGLYSLWVCWVPTLWNDGTNVVDPAD